jgi:copper chaperone
MVTRTYEVPDVSCNHCKRAIEDVLSALDGVEKVDVDVERKTVDVSFDDARVAEGAVRDALAGEGYPVAS